MDHNLRFVQFSHPGREHEPDPSGGKAWNTLNSQHARKFMEFGGKWIEDDGSARSGNLRAWGEWEAESDLVCELSQPHQYSQYPRYLWHPHYVPKDNYKWLHNTDPFIFGERFLYSNCKQQALSGLRHLGRGSVIAFGSGKKVGGERKWVLDTVLVVADSLTYSAPEARRVLAEAAPEAFLTVTGGPMADNEQASFKLYRGATPDDPVDGMFSFFPAMSPHGDAGFPRLLINLRGEYFNPSNWQAQKGVAQDRTSEELRGLWKSLVAQVREAGLLVGTHAALPERRKA